MRDSELRGVILEALYNQRRKDLVNLDQELGGLPVPHSAMESILRQLVKKRPNRTSHSSSPRRLRQRLRLFLRARQRRYCAGSFAPRRCWYYGCSRGAGDAEEVLQHVRL